MKYYEGYVIALCKNITDIKTDLDVFRTIGSNRSDVLRQCQKWIDNDDTGTWTDNWTQNDFTIEVFEIEVE